MSARKHGALGATCAVAFLWPMAEAFAQPAGSPPPSPTGAAPVAPAPSPWTFGVTEADEPKSKAWEKPARIALTIDPDGPDQFSAQINLSAKFNLAPDRPGPRNLVGGYLRWNRETNADKPQNNFELGLSFDHHFDVERLLGLTERERTTLSIAELDYLANDVRPRRIRFDHRVSTGYARTGQYPDLDSATCVATPAAPQCQTQFKESIRTTYAVTMFNPNWSRWSSERGAFSFAPKLQVDHDLLLNSPINVDTGVEAHGSYLSVLAGLGVTLSPTFLNPAWEVQASAALRQRIHASGSRRPSIEGSAEQFAISATYYFLRPPPTERTGWRLGIGVTYTHGGDPLTGTPDGDRIVLALRLGQY